MGYPTSTYDKVTVISLIVAVAVYEFANLTATA